MNRFLNKQTWFLIGWMAVLFLQSSIPGPNIPIKIDVIGWDKLVHIVLYCILAILAYKAFGNKPNRVWIVVIFCIIYGISDEFHQSFVPERYPSVADVVADSIGAGLGSLIIIRFQRKNR